MRDTAILLVDSPDRKGLVAAAHAVAAVYELKERERKAGKANDKTVSILLDQARTAERNAETALRDHTEQHGCLLSNSI